MTIDSTRDIRSYTQKIPLVRGGYDTIEHKISVLNHKNVRTGLMIIGLCGNNGSTLYASILGNRKNIQYETKNGVMGCNYLGSFTQSCSWSLGYKKIPETNEYVEEFGLIKDSLTFVDPNNLVVSGWDINNANMYDACKRACVLEPSLLSQLKDDLERVDPLPGILNMDYIASNQGCRANNLNQNSSKSNLEMVESVREDIRNFKIENNLEKVVVLYSANTEKMLEFDIDEVSQLEEMMKRNQSLPASILYCYASILEGSIYLNGAPQNTLQKSLIKLAALKKVHLGGNDFKSGQTRYKTMMADFLSGCGFKMRSCVSYNHLGNNDGRNLQSEECFQSKKISKSSVLSDTIRSNPGLYKDADNKDESIDHEVVIKYVPFVQDSKRALDEYSSNIFMNGINTISSYNICEDSLLAVPIMIDLVILAEYFSRVTINDTFRPVLSSLSFFFKAPLTNDENVVINSFSKQQTNLLNYLRIINGLEVDDLSLLHLKY